MIFNQDGRLPIEALYAAYDKLVSDYGFSKTIVYDQADLPILVLTTPQTGPALWVLSGVHGEEPAGPNAIAQNIDIIGQLSSQIPIVLFPLCNPGGYVRNWRYPNEYRDWQKGRSVSDSEYLLRPEASVPGPEALAITSKVLELLPIYPPIMSIDHHEDESLEESYVYSQGKEGEHDPIARKVVELMQAAGVSIQMSGTTRFGETVTNGVIGQVPDGSVDELLASDTYIKNGQVIAKPAAKTAIVVETPTIGVPINTRIAAHENIIKNYHELWLQRTNQN